MALRNWRVRTKLIAVLLVPAVAFLVLAGINLSGALGSYRQFGEGVTAADFGGQVTSLAHELQAERDITNGWIADGRPKPKNLEPKDEKGKPALDPSTKAPVVVPPSTGNTLGDQERNVDTAIAAYRSAVTAVGRNLPGPSQGATRDATVSLDQLPALRGAAAARQLTADAVTTQYDGTITKLLNIVRSIGAGSGNEQLTQQVVALSALTDYKELLSQERGLLYGISLGKGQTVQAATDFPDAIARRLAALQRFRLDADAGQRQLYDDTVIGQTVQSVSRLEEVALLGRTEQIETDPTQWYGATTTEVELVRVVELGLLDSVIAQARKLRSDAQRSALVTALIILAILVVALVTSLLIARSMIRPLRRLRSSALDVAENRLPEAIERLRRSDASPDLHIEPIAVDSRDEIGEVAMTFDALHREAIRLATEQAALRSNVNAMFVNLSRRSQSLVERQLTLIDELETGEQDPDQLANLFKLDHLATRMRRNSENLLVLAGEDAGRRWGRPIPLVDVLRAATSEVEQYHRIQLTGVPDVEVMGHSVNHVVHLVAELLENATVFSSPESKVLVHSQRLSDGGSMVEIEDRGIGMTAQEIADANERLARPPVFDVSISRMMGLFVVGRLASRHGITVRLRQSELGGVSAFVRLPVDVLASRFDALAEPSTDGGRPGARPGVPLPPPATMVPAGAGRSGPAGDLPRRALPAGATVREAADPGVVAPEPLPTGIPSASLPDGTMPDAVNLDGRAGSGPHRTEMNRTEMNGQSNGVGPLDAPGSAPGGGPAGPLDGPLNGVGAGTALPRRTPGGTTADPDAPGSIQLPPAGPAASAPPRSGATRYPGRGPAAGPDRPAVPTAVPPGRSPKAPAPLAGPPAPPPPSGSSGMSRDPDKPVGPPPAAARVVEERTPIYEQLQSEWFKQRPAVRAVVDLSSDGGHGAGDAGYPASPGTVESPAAGSPVAASPAPGVAARAAAQAEQPAAEPEQRQPEIWQTRADEGWQAAGRLLAPTTGGVTRAGLPVRVPQAHLVPGGADSAPAPRPASPPAYRSPEAVRSRLASYQQGVRRGRHADRRGDNGDRDPSDVLVQSQEPS